MSSSRSYREIFQDFTKVLIVNPLNTLWSYQICSEMALRANEHANYTYWLNLAVRNNIRKFEMIEKQFISNYTFGKVHKLISNLLAENGILIASELISPDSEFDVPNFPDVDSLRDFHYRDVNLGAIVFSSLASKMNSTSFSIEQVNDLLIYYIRSGIAAIKYLEHFIQKTKPELIVTTNDRFIGSAVTISVARKFKLPYRIVYWGHDTNHFQVYRDSLFNGDEWQLFIAENWQKNPPNVLEKSKIIMEIDELSIRPSKDSLQFLQSQKIGHSPKFDQPTIIFYSQSEHEHSPNLQINRQDRFSSQYEAFEAIQEIASELNFHLILKYHPVRFGLNKNKNAMKMLDWKKVKIASQTSEILPNSSIDTYELIKNATLNIVWDSTVGIESILRNKPTLIVGNPPWLNLDWKIHARTKEEIRRFLLSPFPLVKREYLVPYFWYRSNFGREFKYSKFDANMKLTIKNYLIEYRLRRWKKTKI